MQIDQAIENLYQAFAHYPLRPVVEGCTCGCITEDDHKKLHANPLRELTPDQLEKFAFKALTTWGDVADFKHYFPRIFELLILDDDWLLEGWVIAGKLNLAEWQHWPNSEQVAVNNAFRGWWNHVLQTWPYHLLAEECLYSIALAIGDISSYLETWEHVDTIPALFHLARFVDLNASDIPHHKLLYEWPPDQTQQVINWLLDMRLVDKLEAGFTNKIQDPDIAQAVDILRKLIDQNKTPTSSNNA
jgi:hypothetical protein